MRAGLVALIVCWSVTAHAVEPRIVPPKLVTFSEATLPEGAADKAPPDVETVSVVLMLTIGVDGAVTKVTIRQGAGEPFDTAAREACQRFVFEPATSDADPIAVTVPYTYSFQITRKVVEAPPPPEPERPQGDGVVVGTVAEAGTKAPAIGVMVTLGLRGTKKGEEPRFAPFETVSDARGGFRFEGVPDGKYLVRGAMGEGEARGLATIKDGNTVNLGTLYGRMGRVSRYRTIAKSEASDKAATRIRLEEAEIKTVPGTQGEPTRVIETLPGVARTPFGLPYYVVRGADFQSTGILMDGFNTYFLYHLYGGPAVINSEFIGSLDFYPGGFPVEYGRYSAGLLNVGSVDTPRDTWHFLGELDITKGSFLFSMPFADGKGVIAASLRASWIGAWIGVFAPGTDIGLYYWDYQLRLSYEFCPGTDLTIFLLGAGDHILASGEDEEAAYENEGSYRFVNENLFHRMTVRYNQQLSKNTSFRSDSFIGYLGLLFEFQGGGQPGFVFDSDSLLLAQRLTLYHRPKGPITVAAGVDFQGEHLVFDIEFPGMQAIGGFPAPGDKSPDGMEIFDSTMGIDKWDTAVWFDVTYKLAPGVRLISGMRADIFHTKARLGIDDVADPPSTTSLTADPRITLRAAVTDWLTVKGGTGIFHQMPEPFEMFSNAELGPLWAWQSSGGVEMRFGEEGEWQLDVTGFYNEMYDLPAYSGQIDYDKGEATDEGESGLSEQGFTNSGRGRSYGLEVLFRKRIGEYMFGWLSYTYSRSERSYNTLGEDPNDAGFQGDDQWHVFNLDQPHVLNVAWTVLLPADMSLGARFRLSSGVPGRRIVGAYYDADSDDYEPIVDGVERMPLFHQLDIRWDMKFIFGAWMLEVFVEVQNVYNQSNAEFYQYRYDYRKRSVIGGIPFFPNFGMKWVF